MRDLVLQRRARALRNNSTDAERHLWRYLRAGSLRAVDSADRYPVAGYVADFACLEAAGRRTSMVGSISSSEAMTSGETQPEAAGFASCGSGTTTFSRNESVLEAILLR